jgi:phosphonate transport system substrate-binding protein
MHVQQCRRSLAAILITLLLVPVATSCGPGASSGADGSARTLKISSIPDQDPDKLAARDGAMAGYLSKALGVKVEFVPVTDYAASVSLFHTGDLDLVFYGGLTGVQARLQTPGSVLIAQRDIDDAFQSVFIANSRSGIKPFTSVQGLSVFKGKRFTFGAESSTSGRLMPEYFLDKAGLSPLTDLSGPPGYSGSHDKTIDLVASGTYEGGAVNIQVWKSRLQKKSVDLSKVEAVFTTPTYHDYHWLAGPETNDRFGAGFTDKITAAMLALDQNNPDQAKVLDLYGAKKFIATQASNYREIEEIGRKLKLIG